MKLGRLGVWYSTDKCNGAQVAELVRAVERNGYSAYWYPESRGYESMSLASYLLSKSEKLIDRQLDRQHLRARSLYRRRAMLFAERVLRRALHPGAGRQPHADGRGAARP